MLTPPQNLKELKVNSLVKRLKIPFVVLVRRSPEYNEGDSEESNIIEILRHAFTAELAKSAEKTFL
jgi:hypothetical protein